MRKPRPLSLTVAFVSKTAIASAAASGYTLIKITTLLYIMKNKVIIIASACLLAAGGSAVYVSTRPSASAAAKDSASGSVSSASTNPVTAISQEIVTDSSSRRPRPVSEYQELDEKFGVSQVRLAKSITDSWLKYQVSMNQESELMAADKGKLGEEDEDQAKDPLSSVPGLTLTAEQKAKINAAHVKRRATEQDAIRLWGQSPQSHKMLRASGSVPNNRHSSLVLKAASQLPWLGIAPSCFGTSPRGLQNN